MAKQEQGERHEAWIETDWMGNRVLRAKGHAVIGDDINEESFGFIQEE